MAESNPIFPFSLRFEPSGQYNFSDDYTEDPIDQLQTIKAGSTLFNVYAYDQPKEMGGKEMKIATLVTDSETTRSYYGDEKLLFRH